MTMESGAENQQSEDAAITEAENQQMTIQAQPQIATLAQVLLYLAGCAVYAIFYTPTFPMFLFPKMYPQRWGLESCGSLLRCTEVTAVT